MKVNLIQIGNSKGIIIPKSILDEMDADNFDIRVKDGGIFINPLKGRNTREGWDKIFADTTSKTKPEQDYFEGMENDFDKEEWTW